MRRSGTHPLVDTDDDPAADDGRPRVNDLAALLWVGAGLLGVLDIAWWLSNRLFSP
jgi:hypothetical protein